MILISPTRIKSLLLSACLCLALPVSAAPVDELKAAYILNFAKLTTWPSGIFSADTEPLVFCGFAADPVMDAMRALGERSVDRRPVRVKTIKDPQANKGCHVIYYGQRRLGESEAFFAVRRRGLLLIGDSDGFITSGGTINYFLQGGKLRFEISADNARAAELVISARLLNLARKPEEASP